MLGRVDRFVVHARGEIGSYARWLGVKEEKLRFVPLQKGKFYHLGVSPLREIAPHPGWTRIPLSL
jgi:hypothetical protein